MRLALVQMNTVVGDLDGNRDRIVARLEEAREAGADLVLFPELATTGYPPEDLLLRPGFLRAAAKTLDAVAAETKGIAALVGAPQLWSLRRGPLLPARARARPAPLRGDPRRPDHLRGHLAAWAARYRSRARGSAHRRQHLRVPVSPGQGGRARGDARDPGA